MNRNQIYYPNNSSIWIHGKNTPAELQIPGKWEWQKNPSCAITNYWTSSSFAANSNTPIDCDDFLPYTGVQFYTGGNINQCFTTIYHLPFPQSGWRFFGAVYTLPFSDGWGTVDVANNISGKYQIAFFQYILTPSGYNPVSSGSLFPNPLICFRMIGASECTWINLTKTGVFTADTYTNTEAFPTGKTKGDVYVRASYGDYLWVKTSD